MKVGLADRVRKVAPDVTSLSKDRHFKRRVPLLCLERLVELDVVLLRPVGARSLIVAISVLLFPRCCGGLVCISGVGLGPWQGLCVPEGARTLSLSQHVFRIVSVVLSIWVVVLENTLHTTTLLDHFDSLDLHKRLIAG